MKRQKEQPIKYGMRSLNSPPPFTYRYPKHQTRKTHKSNQERKKDEIEWNHINRAKWRIKDGIVKFKNIPPLFTHHYPQAPNKNNPQIKSRKENSKQMNTQK